MNRPTSSQPPTDVATADRRRAFVLFSLFSVDLTRLARRALGRRSTGNRHVEVLLTVTARPGVTPTEVATTLGVDRSVVSRVLRGLAADGLVARRADPLDGRRACVEPTDPGLARVARFEADLSRYFRESARLLRDVSDLLSTVVDACGPSAEGALAAPENALDVVAALAKAGVPYLDDLLPVLPRLGLANGTDRAAVSIVLERQPVRPSDVGAALHLGSSGTTGLVSRLVDRGYVLRRPDPRDRRAVLLSGTERAEQAREVLEDTLERHADGIAAALARANAFGTAPLVGSARS